MLGIFDTSGCCYGRLCKNVLYVLMVVHIFQFVACMNIINIGACGILVLYFTCLTLNDPQKNPANALNMPCFVSLTEHGAGHRFLPQSP